jgi:hypothetical protein
MSGMGGLNLRIRIRLTRAKKQYAIVKRPLTIENHLSRRKLCPRLTASDSYLLWLLQHILLFGKPLRAFSTKRNTERVMWLRVMNSGTVIMKKIGQSACLLPKSDMIGNGRASETERIWVNNEGLINPSWLKIQSSPSGNLWDYECLLELSARLHFVTHFILFYQSIIVLLHDLFYTFTHFQCVWQRYFSIMNIPIYRTFQSEKMYNTIMNLLYYMITPPKCGEKRYL